MTQEEQLQKENSQQQEQLNAVVDSNDHYVEKKKLWVERILLWERTGQGRGKLC